MPSSVERALADSLSLEHPDVPWALPEVLPATNDLKAALAVLEAQAAPATPKHVAWCLAKLMLAFEPTSKLSADETRLRASVWVEACGDLGDELWSKATLAAIQTCKWMPKPAEFRALVADRLAEREKRLQRCRMMLNGGRAPEKPAQPQETRLQRMQITRGLYEKHGRVADVARLDREIAREQAGAERMRTAVSTVVAAPEREPFKPADTPSNRRLAELAAARREGREPAEYRDVAEAG